MGKYTIEDCKKMAEEKGGKCLSTEYKNCNTKMRWRCKEGHEWEIQFCCIKREHWCRKCYFVKNGINKRLKDGLEKAYKYAEDRDGKCLSTEYNGSETKMEWRCKEDHQWIATFRSVIIRQHWCSQCYHLTVHERCKLKNGLDLAKNYAKDRGGECLSEEYINCKEKLKWKCKFGHEWSAMFLNVYHKHSWCPKCQSNGYSSLAMKWLKGLPNYDNIQHAEDKEGEYKLYKKEGVHLHCKADGYDPTTNTVYEFHGCYWHGCPKCHPDDRDTLLKSKKTREEAYLDTLQKEKDIKDRGYNLITKWECDFRDPASSPTGPSVSPVLILP